MVVALSIVELVADEPDPGFSIILNCKRTRDQVVINPSAAKMLAKSSLKPCSGEIGELWLNWKKSNGQSIISTN